MATAKRFKLFADYRQIHVQDPEGEGRLEDAWTAQASEDRIADGGDIVGIGTKDTADVSVSVEVLGAPPLDDAAEWEHVTESSIDVTSSELAVLGCTDYLKKAKRFAVLPGTHRVRASHANLVKGREQIRVHIWPAPREAACVVKRWSPPPKAPPEPLKRIGSPKQAVRAAMLGETDAALAYLLPRAEKGNFAAAATAIQLLAFRGQWRELVAPAMTVVATEPEAHAARATCLSACALLHRASVELNDASIVEAAASKAPRSLEKETTLRLRGQVEEKRRTPIEERRARFVEHAGSAKTEAAYRGKPKERAQHLMAVAHLTLGLDDELVALWDPDNEGLGFQEATWVAAALARRGDPARAWEVLASRLSVWWPSTIWDAAPVELLFDPDLSSLMTTERREQILATVRGDQAGS